MTATNKTTRKKTVYLRIEFRDPRPGSIYPDWRSYTEDSWPAADVGEYIKEKLAANQFDAWREYRLFSHPEKHVTKVGQWAGEVKIEYGPAELVREWNGIPTVA